MHDTRKNLNQIKSMESMLMSSLSHAHYVIDNKTEMVAKG
mgnify:CR=1 FL=1